jgi:GNAT superfamily N-acetyltransferase
MWKGVESVERMREIWRVNAARMGALAGISFEAAEDLSARVVMLTAKDRRWLLSMTVEAEPPHQLTQWTVERKHDFQLEVREAVPADAQVLADIERRCPVELGETRFWFDRGDDYFAFARLMEDRTIGIASVDGVPAAVSCGARHVVRIAGTLRPIMTVSHLRVLPEHQRKGLWGAANSALNKYRDTTEGSNAYISERNAGMQHGFIDTPNKWAIPVLRMQLPCAALAGPAAGRAARPDDVEAIVARLNRFHGEEEMFVPWTEARLAARLERAPELYSWDRLWLDGEALVGVWPAGDSLRVVTETAGVRTESTRGMVLDYAFAPGAEDAFERLLRAWCGWLAGRGVDALSIFTSPASPGAGLLRALAGEVEAFDMWTPGIEAPADVVRHGVYVDPIYF